MGNRKILLIGGGGHCRSVLDCLLQLNAYDDIGIVEQSAYGREALLGIPIVGNDGDLPRLFRDGWANAFVTIGSIGHPEKRRFFFQQLREIGFALPVIKDPSAVIGREVSLCEGVFVGKRAVVNSGTTIGECAIINTGAIIEHDCSIGSFAHISTGAALCGGVVVGEDTHVGAGAVVCQQTQIGRCSIIGAGSVIIHNVPGNCTVVGNPGRILEK